MMRLLTLTLLSIVPYMAFSQVVVDSPEYKAMKNSGQLGSQVVTQNPAIQNPPAHPHASNPVPKANSCNCYVEPDATYQLALQPNDDGSSANIPIPFSFCLYGTQYTSLRINNNGNLTFNGPMSTFSATAFPSTGNPIVAPFWGDVDTGSSFNVLGEVRYKITPTALYVNWEDVGYFSQQGDKRNTFQVIITDGTDPVIEGGNVAFCYGDMQWTTGSASSGVNGFGGVPATAGANKGDGVNYFLISRFDHPGNDFDGALGDPDGISWLDYKSFAFDACNVGNIPPIPDGVSSCDTFRVCSVGDTADISINFLSPETNQITSITYTDGGLTSLQEIANISGNTAQLVLRVIGDLATVGDYTINVTATDNASPTQGVTTLSFVIQIDNSGALNFNPVLSPDPFIACDTLPLTVLNGPYDTYLWDDLTNEETSGVGQSGDYGVTVSLNGCYKRVHEYVTIINPTPLNLQSPFTFCPPATSVAVYVPDSAAFSDITWGLANPALDSIFYNTLPAGTYTVSAMDSSGYCTTDTTFTIATQQPLVLQPDAVICVNTFTFTANTGGTPSGTWTVLNPGANPPTFANNNLNTTVTFPEDGTFSLVYTTSGSCTDVDTVVITAGTPPSYVSVGGYFYCPDDLGTDIYFPDSTQLGSITWGLANQGLDTLFSNTLTAGTYTVEITDITGNCPTDSTFTITTQPVLNLEDDFAICYGTHTFTGNTGGSGTGVWSVVQPAPGPVTFSSNTALNPSINILNRGVYYLVYTEANCGEDDTVQVIYADIPVFNFTNDFFVCPGDLEQMVYTDSSDKASITWGLPNPAQDTLYTVNLTAGTYTVEVENIYGCTNDTTFTITTQPGVVIEDFPFVCGDTLEFDNNTGIQTGLWTVYGSAGIVNFRNPNDLNTGLDVSEFGTYHLVFTEPTCQEADTLHVEFIPYAYVDLNPEVEICVGQFIDIEANNPYPLFTESTAWTSGVSGATIGANTNMINTGVPGMYYVTVTNECNSHTDSILVSSVICDFNLPNVFTPDGDNINDLWQLIEPQDIFLEFHCEILNRWGGLVYEFDNYMSGWNGKDKGGNEMEDGVYFYRITYTTLGNEELEKSGFFHLERD
jgi:gliding motility-associated-like protein